MFSQQTYHYYDRNKTRLGLVIDSIREIGKLIDIENEKNEELCDLHIIAFNCEAKKYTKKRNQSIDDFLKYINLYPHDTTDYTDANKKFKKLKDKITNKTISLFLSDGYDNSDNNYDCLYDYSIGIGTETTVDDYHLKTIANKYVCSNDSSIIEDVMIGSIFSDMQQQYNDVKISLIVPEYCDVLTLEKYNITYVNECPVTTQNIPFTINMIKNDDTNIINIKPEFIYDINEDKDIIFVVDISGSMDQRVEQKSHFTIPSPDIHDYTVLTQVEDYDVTDDDTNIVDIANNSLNEDENNIIQTLQSQFTNEQVLDIDTTITSVFDDDTQYSNLNRDIEYTYKKYNFDTIQTMNKFDENNFIINNIESTDLVSICIEVNGKTYYKTCMYSDFIHDDNVIVYNEMVKLRYATNKILDMNKNALRKEFIKELYTYINNTVKRKRFKDLLEVFDGNDTIKHTISTLEEQINILYASITTIGELGCDRYRNNNIETMERNISTRICRGITQSQQTVDTDIIEKNSSALDIEKECIMCCSNKRSIIYTCGHCVMCSDCNVYLLFDKMANKPALQQGFFNTHIRSEHDNKTCPICRDDIKGFLEIKNSDFTCMTDGCIMTPTIICRTCLQPIYCKTCWKNTVKKLSGSTSKKRKRITIPCKCGENINKYIEAIFN